MENNTKSTSGANPFPISDIKDRMRELEDSRGDKNRIVVPLLELMLENQELFDCGLCSWIAMLRLKNIISNDEFVILRMYVRLNRPSIFSSWGAFRQRNRLYHWPSGNIKPRIKWINQHIAKLKTQN